MRKFVSPGIFLKKKGPEPTRESIREKGRANEAKRIEGLLTSEGAENLTTTEYARLKAKLKRLRKGQEALFTESFGLSPRLNPKFMPETAKAAFKEEQKRTWIQRWQKKPIGQKKQIERKERTLKPLKMPTYKKV